MKQLLLILSFLSISLLGKAEIISGTCGEKIIYAIDTNTGVMRISGIGEMEDHNSQSEFPWWNSNNYVKKLIIDPGITSIGNYSFVDFDNLIEVIVPSTVTNIGEQAFGHCDKLEYVHIEQTKISIINRGTFCYCPSLKTIKIPKTVVEISYAAFNESGLESIHIPNGVKSIGMLAFGCPNLRNVYVYWENPTDIDMHSSTFRGGVTLNVPIGTLELYTNNYASGQFANIKEQSDIVSFEDDIVKSLCVTNWDANNDGELSMNEAANVTDIGDVFKGNEEIIAFNELRYFIGLRTIGVSAFEDCFELKSIEMPISVSIIDYGAFRNCSALEYVTLPENVIQIGDFAFNGCGFRTVEIPASVEKIGKGAFSVNRGLFYIYVDEGNVVYESNGFVKSIIEKATGTLVVGCLYSTIPDRVTKIGDNAFQNCSELTNISLPNKITSVGTGAFGYCSNLESIDLPDSLKIIGMSAFWGTGLTTITTPEDLDSLFSCAFVACPNLVKANINSRVIHNEVFGGCPNLKSLSIGKSARYIAEGLFGVSFTTGQIDSNNLEEIKVANDNQSYDSRNSCNAIIKTETNELVLGCNNTLIPNTVTSIGDFSFINCTGLEEIHIPKSIINIGYRSFFNCHKLTNIIIPKSVTRIGDWAFYGCNSLTSVTVEWATVIPTVNSNVFSNRANATLYVPYGCKSAYEAADVWKEFKEIVEMEPEELTLTLNQYGKSTYCSEYALDFTNVEGLKAYVATGYNTRTGVVTMTRVMTTKGGTGLFLKGTQGSYQVPIIAESDDNTLNLLVGTLAQVTVNSKDDTYTNYKFTVKAGETEPGFYNFEDNSTLSANKAYLHIPTAWLPSTSAAKSVRMWFEDEEPTGIDEINTNRPDSDTIYDMQGRRIKTPGKGIYIVNGKKMIIK